VWRPTHRHVFAVLAAFVSIYFAMRTSQAVLDNRALAEQLQRNRALALALELQNAALREEVAYERTPAFVERAAREQLGLMQPGDHVIQLKLAPPPAAPSPTPPAGAAAPPAPNWRRWLELFADPPPASAAPR
jgi:cell division protein FtsB